MGTRVAERTVKIRKICLFTIGAPFPAVFDLLRPLLLLGTAVSAVRDKSNAETGIGVAMVSAWDAVATVHGPDGDMDLRIMATAGQLWLWYQSQMDLLGWREYRGFSYGKAVASVKEP